MTEDVAKNTSRIMGKPENYIERKIVMNENNENIEIMEDDSVDAAIVENADYEVEPDNDNGGVGMIFLGGLCVAAGAALHKGWQWLKWRRTAEGQAAAEVNREARRQRKLSRLQDKIAEVENTDHDVEILGEDVNTTESDNK